MLHGFQANCIGTGGLVIWPVRFPDLNPWDFYVWSYLKVLACS